MEKHLIFCGSGITPNIVIDDDKADEMVKMEKGGETIEEDLIDGEHIYMKGEECRAVNSKSWGGKNVS